MWTWHSALIVAWLGSSLTSGIAIMAARHMMHCWPRREYEARQLWFSGFLLTIVMVACALYADTLLASLVLTLGSLGFLVLISRGLQLCWLRRWSPTGGQPQAHSGAGLPDPVSSTAASVPPAAA